MAIPQLKLSITLLTGFYSMFKEKRNERMFSGTDIEFWWEKKETKRKRKEEGKTEE